MRTGKSGWMLKFFLPYCPHCKSMEGDWIRFASYMKGLMNVGEIDCSKHTSFCRELGVFAVPMIFYYKGRYNISYIGPRKVKNFRQIAYKILQSRSALVQNLDIYSKYSSRFPIFFIYYYRQLTIKDIVIISFILRHKYWQILFL